MIEGIALAVYLVIGIALLVHQYRNDFPVGQFWLVWGGVSLVFGILFAWPGTIILGLMFVVGGFFLQRSASNL